MERRGSAICTRMKSPRQRGTQSLKCVSSNAENPGVCFPPCLSVSSSDFHASRIVWVFSRPCSKESVSYSKSSACSWKGSSDYLWSSLITEDGDFQPLDRKISCDVFYGIFRARVYSQNERSPRKCCPLLAPMGLLTMLWHWCTAMMKIILSRKHFFISVVFYSYH